MTGYYLSQIRYISFVGIWEPISLKVFKQLIISPLNVLIGMLATFC